MSELRHNNTFTLRGPTLRRGNTVKTTKQFKLHKEIQRAVSRGRHR